MRLLELDSVTKRFGGLVAVRGLSFAVEEGEILGLIGPNGSGKTTLFNLINGYDTPDSGSILFRGERIDGQKPHRVCQKGLGRTFQVVRPLARLSALENVMVAAFSKTSRVDEARRLAGEAMELVGMTAWRDHLAGGLPLGMRKRLEMARAVATEPSLLLLDESFAGLNPSEVEATIAVVRSIHARGISILIIEHNMRVIMAISSRILAIHCGEKLAEGAPADVARDPRVVEAYLGGAHA